ncbi:hypothetical protein HRbin36_01391 [bacterium HR36]|nr:hypothetical protein HRbin36_01391 [bacterium HR36]
MCYGAQRNWSEQVRCLRQAWQLEPSNTRFAVHLGLALARAEHWQEAEHQLVDAVGPGRAYYYLALMAEHLGRRELVHRYAQAAVQADPTYRQEPHFQQWLAGGRSSATGARPPLLDEFSESGPR